MTKRKQQRARVLADVAEQRLSATEAAEGSGVWEMGSQRRENLTPRRVLGLIETTNIAVEPRVTVSPRAILAVSGRPCARRPASLSFVAAVVMGRLISQIQAAPLEAIERVGSQFTAARA